MRVIDYTNVLEQATADGLRCVYPNGGAFVPVGEHRIVGWIGPDDSTIRADLPATIVRCAPPYPQRLAEGLVALWPGTFNTPLWVVPKSHWAYELDHAHQDWLLEILQGFGIDTVALAKRTDAPAIEFAAADLGSAEVLMQALLTHLKTSDYAVLTPGRSVVATLHHHQQIWWQTPDAGLAERLSVISPTPGGGACLAW